ncbi:hypothetical protein ACWEQP_19000 [Streptomyces sp. NPDC004044]
MTLVQVKRPDRRFDTAEVIPTVTREVDDEGVMKAYRGDDAPTRENDLAHRQEDLADVNPAAAGAITTCGTASGARGTTTTPQLLGPDAGHPIWRPLPATGRARSTRKQ